MALSQMAEYTPSLDELLPAVSLVFELISKDNSAIRMACFHCLGQFAVDKKHEFVEKLRAAVFEPAEVGFKDQVLATDQHSRVQAYACSYLTNLLQYCTWEHLEPCHENLLGRLLELIRSDSLLVCKSAVAALSAFCIASHQHSARHFKSIYTGLVLTFKQSHQKSQLLLCRLIENLSIAAFYAAEEDFRAVKAELVFILKHVEETIPGLEDQRVSPLLLAWKRLVVKMRDAGEEFSEYIVRILVKVLGQCDEFRALSLKRKSLLDLGGQVAPVELDSKQLETAFLLLECVLQNLDLSGAQFAQALDRLTQSCNVAASSIPDPAVCHQAVACLEKLLRLAMKADFHKVASAQQFALLFKAAQSLLLDKASEEASANTLRKLALCSNAYKLGRLVRIPVFESQIEINIFYSGILSLMRVGLLLIFEAEKRLERAEEDELEPQELANFTEQKSLELQCLKQLLGLAGHVVRFHPSLSDVFCEDLYTGVFCELNGLSDWIVGCPHKKIKEVEVFTFCLLFRLVRCVGRAFLEKVSLDALFDVSEK